MQLDKNYDRSIPEGGEMSGDVKYKEHYEPYPFDHDATPINVEILLAQSGVVERQNQKGGKYSQEMMTVVLKAKEKYWIRLTMKGAYIKDDGSAGRNPLQLHNFLCLAERQCENCLANGSSFTFKDGRTVVSYPKLVGLKFKVVIATIGEYQGYEVNDFAFFDVQGRSAVDLEQGKVGDYSDLQLAVDKLRAKHIEFVNWLTDNNPYGNVQSVQPEQPKQDVKAPQSLNSAFAKDDIPF